jgi:hypothetical protein
VFLADIEILPAWRRHPIVRPETAPRQVQDLCPRAGAR